MATVPELMPCTPSESKEGGDALQGGPLDGFLSRLLASAGLTAIAKKVADGRDLELDEAVALSRASLPLLGKIVELRPSNSDSCGPDAARELPVARTAVGPIVARRTGQALTDWNAFCEILISMRNEVRPNEHGGFWYPILNNPLDRDNPGDGDFTGVDVLRAIALARLILPAEIEVRAPLASLGPKLAQVALDFGASHLGYVAPEGQTPGDALVADSKVFDELLESCSPTALKDS
jgi:hypothetical protein